MIAKIASTWRRRCCQYRLDWREAVRSSKYMESRNEPRMLLGNPSSYTRLRIIRLWQVLKPIQNCFLDPEFATLNKKAILQLLTLWCQKPSSIPRGRRLWSHPALMSCGYYPWSVWPSANCVEHSYAKSHWNPPMPLLSTASLFGTYGSLQKYSK